MEIDYKIKGLEKMFNKLVVPKVNGMEKKTKYKINKIHIYSHMDNPYYKIFVVASINKVPKDEYSTDLFFLGMSNLFKNAFEYIEPYGDMEIEFSNEYDEPVYNTSFHNGVERLSDTEAINYMAQAKWKKIEYS